MIVWSSRMSVREMLCVITQSRGVRLNVASSSARLAVDPASVVLDARSTDKYKMLHIVGAKHLSLPDMTAAELARIIPAKDTRVLIYCNNNFLNAPEAFPGKVSAASLNIYTFNTLYSYGYTNVYELGPLINVTATKLPLEGTGVPNK